MTRIDCGGRRETLSRAAVAAALMFAVVAPLPVKAGGDVTVSVVGGNLIIKGDDAPDGNGIFISPAGAGAYDVQGDGLTTVNGANAVFNAGGVTGDVKITMNDGDDFVEIEDTNAQPFPDDVVIRTGKGNDAV